MKNNGTSDTGGFDLDKEREAATERMLARLEQLDTDLIDDRGRTEKEQRSGGPTSMDILSH